MFESATTVRKIGLASGDRFEVWTWQHASPPWPAAEEKTKVACSLCDFFYPPIQAQRNHLSALSVRASFPSFNRCAS
jgi:hypothetical protein